MVVKSLSIFECWHNSLKTLKGDMKMYMNMGIIFFTFELEIYQVFEVNKLSFVLAS